ncbi:MAG: proline--tRNA ligase [Candidatus Bostrichicola ureolyticus]|nr:MAG: proline--tRNA ligase [Candidatus Bostrichicola ureolyticus]
MAQLTSRIEDYSKWYNEIIIKANLAETSNVRGCMIIKPYGFAIWEKIQNILNKKIKNTGHENIYFPLFIPKSLFSKEACHIDGFSQECAVVTHYRLKKTHNNNIIIDPKSKLDEELIVRPTSETIIWHTYRSWIKSYRDLPILINQWANIIRWEMHNRLFLRTSECLWQEGHTAHINKEEAIFEAKQMLNIYTNFIENYMAIPVIQGVKTAIERFAGAEETYCIEAIMQNGKALQIGTSHFLGQNFSKAFNVKFTNNKGYQEYVWGTSWGISTRLIGALIMSHSDDKGLVLPPKLAPMQTVIIPIFKNEEQLKRITKIVCTIKKTLKDNNISFKYDDRNIYTPGWKFNEYELKGVPIRINIGIKDLEKGTVEIVRRDNLNKQFVNYNYLGNIIPDLLTKIQKNLFKKALERRNNFITKVDDYNEFKKILNEKGGFMFAHWDGTSETEKKIKLDTKTTIRCIPLKKSKEKGKCIYSGKPSNQRVFFAKAY